MLISSVAAGIVRKKMMLSNRGGDKGGGQGPGPPPTLVQLHVIALNLGANILIINMWPPDLKRIRRTRSGCTQAWLHIASDEDDAS